MCLVLLNTLLFFLENDLGILLALHADLTFAINLLYTFFFFILTTSSLLVNNQMRWFYLLNFLQRRLFSLLSFSGKSGKEFIIQITLYSLEQWTQYFKPYCNKS